MLSASPFFELQELLRSVSLEFTKGKAEVTEVSQCNGDVSLVFGRISWPHFDFSLADILK